MKKIVIAGGGVTGLSAAVFLSKNNHQVELIEAAPLLGGRARSFYDPQFGSEIDNGQHLLMGCYRETLKFLEETGGTDGLLIQDDLKIPFAEINGKITFLKSESKIYPFNLLSAILNFKIISFRERLSALNLFVKLIVTTETDFRDRTVVEWLNENKQSRRISDVLWEPLVVSTMNTHPEKASAEIFIRVLKEVFLSGKKGSNLIIPKTGLSKLFVEKSVALLEKRGVKIYCSEPVKKVIVEGNRAKSISTSKRGKIEFDELVLAVPPHSLQKIEGLEKLFSPGSLEYQYSPIITVYLKINNNHLTEPLYSIVESDIHWVFNHGEFISVVLSGADKWIDLSSEEIIDKTKEEVSQYLNLKQGDLTSARVIKEKRATIVLNPEGMRKRKIRHPLRNLHIAGDWTDTGLPATIEGGIVSGRKIRI